MARQFYLTLGGEAGTPTPGEGWQGIGTLLNSMMLPYQLKYPCSYSAASGTALPEAYWRLPGWLTRSNWLVAQTTTAYGDRVDAATITANADSLGLTPYYAGVAFNLEGSTKYDPAERADPAWAHERCREIADTYGVLLCSAMGDGYREGLTDAQVQGCAALSDWWLIQGQRSQAGGPGEPFKTKLIRRMDQALGGNQGLAFVIQLSDWAGRNDPVTPELLYEYLQNVIDLSDTYDIRHVTMFHNVRLPWDTLDGVFELYFGY